MRKTEVRRLRKIIAQWIFYGAQTKKMPMRHAYTKCIGDLQEFLWQNENKRKTLMLPPITTQSTTTWYKTVRKLKRLEKKGMTI